MVRIGSKPIPVPARRRRGIIPTAALALLIGCGGAGVVLACFPERLTMAEAMAASRAAVEESQQQNAAVAIYRHCEDGIVELKRVSRTSGPPADNAERLLAHLRTLLEH